MAFLRDPTAHSKDFATFLPFPDAWNENPTFAAADVCFCVCGALILIHALRSGKRFCCLLFAIYLHGMFTEILSYMLADIDNFWHAQSSVMLFWKRAPVYIIVGLYPAFYYVATVVCERMNISRAYQPLAVGAVVLLIDLPLDLLGAKFLWWTWHTTDPNIFDRLYSVPVVSFVFHLTFASSFSFIFNSLYERKLRFLAVAFAGLLSFPLGALQFIPLYHLAHDLHGVTTTACLVVFLSLIGVALFLSASVSSAEQKKKKRRKLLRIGTGELQLVVVLMFVLFAGCALFGEPEKASSTGIHQGFTRDAALAEQVEVVHTAMKIVAVFMFVLFAGCALLGEPGEVSSTGLHQGSTRDAVLTEQVEVVHTEMKASGGELLLQELSLLASMCCSIMNDTSKLHLVVVLMFALFAGCALLGEPGEVSSTSLHQGFTRDAALAEHVEVVHTAMKDLERYSYVSSGNLPPEFTISPAKTSTGVTHTYTVRGTAHANVLEFKMLVISSAAAACVVCLSALRSVPKFAISPKKLAKKKNA